MQNVMGPLKQALLATTVISFGAMQAAPAMAQNIDTTPSWNGVQSVFSWGETDTATYGQTITATASQFLLSGFTYYLRLTGGTPPNFQAFVYEWNPATQRATGPALFTSAVMTAPSGNSFVPVAIDTGAVVLTPGKQYVLC